MDKRMADLLRNASRCFHEAYSPFSHSELSRLNVTADECGELSEKIGDILDLYLETEHTRFSIAKEG